MASYVPPAAAMLGSVPGPVPGAVSAALETLQAELLLRVLGSLPPRDLVACRAVVRAQAVGRTCLRWGGRWRDAFYKSKI